MKGISSAAPLVALATAAIIAGSATATRVKPHPPAWQLSGPGGFAFGFGSAWIAGGGSLLRVDPRSNRVTATIPSTGRWPIALSDGIWIDDSSTLDRIDPARNRVVTRIPLPSDGGLTYGFGSFWVAGSDGNVLRVDPVAKDVVATIAVEANPDWALQIAAGEGGVFVASADGHEVVKIDPGTNQIAWTARAIGNEDSLLTVGAGYGAVWAHENAGARGRGLLFRIDPASGHVISTLTTSRVAGGEYGGTDIAFGAGSIWTGNANGTVSRIAPDGSKVLSSVRPLLLTEFLAIGLSGVWIQGDDGRAARIALTRFAG